MPDYPTPDGGRYKYEGGVYTYYANRYAQYGIIKTKEEIDKIMKMWTRTQWNIYAGVLMICAIIFVLMFVFVADSTLTKWIFGVLMVLPFVVLIISIGI